MSPPASRNTRKILLLGLLVACSNYMSFSVGRYRSFFNDYIKANADSARPCDALEAAAPSAATPSLRGASAPEGVPDRPSDAPVSGVPPKVRFTEPSPHLWTHIPVVPPHVGRKTVLVTGAAGFIGSHVAGALLERGDEVIVVDEMNDYYDVRVKEGNLELLRATARRVADETNGDPRGILTIYRGDINNQTLMHDIFERHEPKWVCHLAARAGVRPSIQDPLLYVRANAHGTTNMLEYGRAHGAINMVVASSSSVYGESESTFFSEAEDVNRPVSPYASTKRSGELISYTYHHLYGMNVTNLRFFTVYGPRGRPDMAPYKFVDRVRRGAELQKFGSGETSRDYTYISDIVDGVVRSIDRAYPYQIINLGKGAGTTLNEFIALVEAHVGRRANVRAMPEQPGDVPFTNADVSKAERLLGYASKVTIDEGIRRTVAWFNATYGADEAGTQFE